MMRKDSEMDKCHEGDHRAIENNHKVIDELQRWVAALQAKNRGLKAETKGLKKELEAKLKQHRWIPVSERLPKLEDGNEHDRQLADGTINVLGYDDGFVFETNYYPELDVWNGLTPILWKPIILPEQALVEK